jgi:hypothetical protein
MSVSMSDSECIPSAIIAALCPNDPAAILPAVSTRFTMAPHRVTLRISFSLDFIIFSWFAKIMKNQILIFADDKNILEI